MRQSAPESLSSSLKVTPICLYQPARAGASAMWSPIWPDCARTGSIIGWTATAQRDGLMRKSYAPQVRRSNGCLSDGTGQLSVSRSSKMIRSWALQLVGRSETPLRTKPTSGVLSKQAECHPTLSCSHLRDRSPDGERPCGRHPPRRSCFELLTLEVGGWAFVTIP